MRVLILEDEHFAAQKLMRLLKETDRHIEVVDVIRSVEQAINWFPANPAPDLIFMDIQLEDGISFEIFESITIRTPIIFTTAYDEYALKAFKVNSVDYLLKPINPDELKKALDKFNTIHGSGINKTALESILNQLKPQTKERFLIRIGDHYKSVPVTDIHCFYVMERCTFSFTNTGKSYPMDYSLDQIEQLVHTKNFFRVNRNFIIHLQAIQDVIAYSSSRLKIIVHGWKEKEEIIVSRERVAAFKKWMDE